MTRKEFLTQVGLGAAAILLPTCIGACQKNPTTSASLSIDFTLNVSSGTLAKNGGFLINQGVIVARTLTGTFIAVAATCTHQGSTIEYLSPSNSFLCPNHGATFNSTGAVTQGPAGTNLQQFKTTLTGSSLRVYS